MQTRLSEAKSIPRRSIRRRIISIALALREWTESDLLLAVKKAFDKQEFANAEKLAREVLRDQPRFDDVRVLLGRSLLALGRNAEADREFRAVLEEKLPSPRSIAWANVGLADIASKAG